MDLRLKHFDSQIRFQLFHLQGELWTFGNTVMNMFSASQYSRALSYHQSPLAAPPEGRRAGSEGREQRSEDLLWSNQFPFLQFLRYSFS